MSNIMSIDHIAVTTNEIPDVGREFSNPNTITRGTGSQTPGIITVYV